MSSEERSVTNVFRVRSDSIQEDLGISSDLFVQALRQNGELRWLFSRDGSQGTVTVYDLQGAVLAHVTPPDGMQVYYPVSMLTTGACCWSSGMTRSMTTGAATRDGRGRISEREYGVYGDGVCGVSVIARTAFTGRTRARVVGDADPYGCPARWMSAWRRVRAPRPTGNGMVTVGADARIVFAAARRTGCRAACLMPPWPFASE